MKKFGRPWVEPVSGMYLQMYTEGEGSQTKLIVPVNHKQFQGTDVLKVREAANAYAASLSPENWTPVIRIEVKTEDGYQGAGLQLHAARLWYNQDHRTDASVLVCDWDDKDPTHRAASKYPIKLEPYWGLMNSTDGDNPREHFSLPYAQYMLYGARLYLPYTDEQWEQARQLEDAVRQLADNLREALYMQPDAIGSIVLAMKGAFKIE